MTGSSSTSLLVSGTLLAGALWSWARANRTRKWPSVRPVVEAFTAVGRQRILAGQPSTAHVEYAVTARYTVADREHRVQFYLAAPPDDAIELRYNPRDPADFVVGTQSRWLGLLLLALSLLFLAEGLAP